MAQTINMICFFILIDVDNYHDVKYILTIMVMLN